MESKKRSLEDPNTADKAEAQVFEGAKKPRVMAEQSPKAAVDSKDGKGQLKANLSPESKTPAESSPVLRKTPTITRTLKVIPPKEPSGDSKDSKQTEPFKLKLLPDSTPADSPDAVKKDQNDASKTLETDQKQAETVKEGDAPKKEQPKPQTAMEKTLAKMELEIKPEKMLEMIRAAQKSAQASIIINDSRLFAPTHPNYNVYLGHVNYTGAKSRALHSNRAVDLELFLMPQFTSNHHFCTIQVRIPYEYLTYRGNIAVRKSALWGTDIYTDDSDIVAMIIHSGHYKPVDAADATSVGNSAERSRISKTGPISCNIEPVIAQPDKASVSTNILFPDHDLHVTLRILPRLVKYTGSTRFGLDSNGWGPSHDGESVKVEYVERVERASVVRNGRKSPFKKQSLHSPTKTDTRTIMFSQSQLNFQIKYLPSAVNNWPLHVLKSAVAKECNTDLKVVEEWPFWRAQLATSKTLCFQNANQLFILELVDGAFRLLDERMHVLQMHEASKDCIEFTDQGLEFVGSVVPIQKFYWQ